MMCCCVQDGENQAGMSEDHGMTNVSSDTVKAEVSEKCVASDNVDVIMQQLGKHSDTVSGSDEEQSESPPKKKKKRSSGGDASKNALQTLNELMPGLKYSCINQTGPVHQPTFTVQVMVNGQVCCHHHLVHYILTLVLAEL